MGRFFRMTLPLAVLLALAGVARAEAAWRITTPYQGNPLKVAVLSGEGTASGNHFPASLEFSCHPGAAVPRVVLRVPVMVADWDFHAYDSSGSGSVSLRRRFLKIMAANRRVIDRPVYTGIAGDNASFMFSWQPNEALLARLTRRQDGVQVVLDGLRRNQGNMQAHFVIPADASLMLSVLRPCSGALSGQKGAASDAK